MDGLCRCASLKCLCLKLVIIYYYHNLLLPNDIPKGWQLPTAGSQADGKSGSFQNLLSKYGVASSVSGTGVDGVAYNIAAGPLYFVRSARVNLTVSAGTLGYAGQYGYWWSSRAAAYTSSTSANAYDLSFNATAVYPSYGPSNRWNGFPLRCLSTVLDM